MTYKHFLENPQNFNTLVAYYFNLRGSNVPYKVNIILKSSIHDTLSSKFNYFGRKEKSPFNKLKIWDCIIEAKKFHEQLYNSNTDRELLLASGNTNSTYRTV